MSDDRSEHRPTTDSLVRVAELSRLMLQQEADLERANAAVAAAKEALLRTRREDLPELMREVGLSSVRLESGETVTVTDDVSAAIPAAMRERAFQWLEEHGFGGLIKTELTIQYGRDERETALADAERIAELTGRAPSVGQTVHTQTLRAFIREQMEKGNTVPFDLFGVHPYSEAKIKR